MDAIKSYFKGTSKINYSDCQEFLANCKQNQMELLSANASSKIDEALSNMNIIVSDYIKRYNSSYGPPKVGNIYVCIYQTQLNTPNGFTVKYGSSYFIGISSYVFNVMPILIENLSSSITPESLDITFNKRYLERVNIDNPIDTVIDMKFPLNMFCNDKISNVIFNNTLNMILDHEVGHIMAGHSESPSFFFELKFSDDKNRINKPFESQLKEYQADFLGVKNHVNYLLKQQSSLEKLKIAYFLELVSMSYMLSLFIYPQVLEENQINNKKLNKIWKVEDDTCYNSHPPYHIRFHYLQTFIASELIVFIEEYNKKILHGSLKKSKIVAKWGEIKSDGEAMFNNFMKSISSQEGTLQIQDVLLRLNDESKKVYDVEKYLITLQKYFERVKHCYKGFIPLAIPTPELTNLRREEKRNKNTNIS